MRHTLIQFPDVKLARRDGHKLRGYFANLFGKESDYFHNHRDDGRVIYRYPIIQYKVIYGLPTLLGIGEGAQLLNERFLQIDHLDIYGWHVPIFQKNIQSGEIEVGVTDDLLEYEFVNPWMALNEKNYDLYQKAVSEEEKKQLLKRLLIVNMLHFFGAVSHREERQILASLQLNPIWVNFKNQRMLAFKGRFTTNARLPDYIGFGKSVSRGYGAIRRLK